MPSHFTRINFTIDYNPPWSWIVVVDQVSMLLCIPAVAKEAPKETCLFAFLKGLFMADYSTLSGRLNY